MQCNLFKIPNTMHRKVTHLPNTFTVKKPVSAPKRKKGTYFAVNSFQGVKINIAQSTEKFRCKMKLFGFSFLCSSNPTWASPGLSYTGFYENPAGKSFAGPQKKLPGLAQHVPKNSERTFWSDSEIGFWNLFGKIVRVPYVKTRERSILLFFTRVSPTCCTTCSVFPHGMEQKFLKWGSGGRADNFRKNPIGQASTTGPK